jgi:hypothetical protein
VTAPHLEQTSLRFRPAHPCAGSVTIGPPIVIGGVTATFHRTPSRAFRVLVWRGLELYDCQDWGTARQAYKCASQQLRAIRRQNRQHRETERNTYP